MISNCAVKTTSLVKSSDGKHYKKKNFKSVIGKVKKSFKTKFSIIQAHIAGACIKKHVDSFNGCVELKNKNMDKNYDRPVNLPHEHEDGCLHNIIIPKESITSSKKKLEKGYIELPLSREYKKKLESSDCRPRIDIPENIRDKKIIQVEIIPVCNGRMFKANFTYQIEKEPLDLDKDKVMGIDIGVNNFATIVTTEGTPFIVDGRFLKNQIAFRCKKIAHYQSILDQQGLKKSKRIDNINNRFKGIQNNFLNHTVKFIIDTCKEQDIGTIIHGIQQQLPIQKQHGEKTKPNILTNCFQTIQRKTRNTNTKTRHNTNNTRRILHKQKQLLRL